MEVTAPAVLVIGAVAELDLTTLTTLARASI
jgi:hypothetical protein